MNTIEIAATLTTIRTKVQDDMPVARLSFDVEIDARLARLVMFTGQRVTLTIASDQPPLPGFEAPATTSTPTPLRPPPAPPKPSIFDQVRDALNEDDEDR